jgi:lipopolysaccharide transport system ATP-binding protein
MPEVLIQAESLGKRYIIGHQAQRERYFALRDVIARGARNFLRKTSDLMHGRAVIEGDELEEVWALRDVSFEVRRGEVLGIIGRNGAGKSTLLKVLSRITEPSVGRVLLRGRVASLLEVGTGFHPELTGRENIFLNGAILGMSRTEIRMRFDAIAEFAQVERFLDTPVKRYSSGMYVRLAFAVAAHLEPDILVVDEVLAVGDAEFQKKCLGKLKDVSQSGRTVLFVSHNMAAVQSLCERGLLLSGGSVVAAGSARDVVATYLDASLSHGDVLPDQSLGRSLSLTRLDILPATVRCRQRLTLELEITAGEADIVSDLAILLHSAAGDRVALIYMRQPQGPFRLRPGGRLGVTCDVEGLPLVEGDLNVGLYIFSDSVCQAFMNLRSLTVLPGVEGAAVPPREAQFRGVVELKSRVECTLA